MLILYPKPLKKTSCYMYPCPDGYMVPLGGNEQPTFNHAQTWNEIHEAVVHGTDIPGRPQKGEQSE